jgi:catechol 2,3-dioxygenase-like lactoylglutathione lyase family enzyme
MIFVRDLGALERFYRDAVGLVPVEATRHPDWVEFEGAARFSLHQIPAHILPGLPPLLSEPRESGSTKLSFAVPSVAAEVARLRGLGVRVIERPWGSFDFVDPEGNISGLDGPSGAEEVKPLMAAEPVAVASLPEPEPEPESDPEPAKREWWSIRVPSLLVMLIFGWVMAAIAGLVPQLTFIFAARTIVAGPIVLAGLVAMAVGAFRGPSATRGLFGDPAYLGMVLVLAGWAVFLCNPPSLLGLLAFILVMNRRRA